MAHPNRSRTRRQSCTLRDRFAQRDGIPFADVLPADRVERAIRTAGAGSIQIGDGLYVRLCAPICPGVGNVLDTGWLPIESAENVTGDYTPVVRVVVELGALAQAVQACRDDSERT